MSPSQWDGLGVSSRLVYGARGTLPVRSTGRSPVPFPLKLKRHRACARKQREFRAPASGASCAAISAKYALIADCQANTAGSARLLGEVDQLSAQHGLLQIAFTAARCRDPKVLGHSNEPILVM